MRRRGLPLVVVLAAVSAWVGFGLVGAQAAPPTSVVHVTGFGPATITAPSTVEVDYTITVTGAPVDGAVLHAAEPATLVADTTSVQVQGVPASAGTVDKAGAGLTIRLGTGADAADGGHLNVGAYLVSFEVAVPKLPPANTIVSATLNYRAGSGAGAAKSDPVAMTQPDLVLAVPAHSGEDQPLPLGTGDTGDFAVVLTDPGADVAAATLTITVPAGLRVDTNDEDDDGGVYRDDQWQSDDYDGGIALPCRHNSPHEVTCALGAVRHGVDSLVQVPLVATSAAKYGATAKFGLAATPDTGVDSHPADNSISGSIRFTGIAHLKTTLTRSSTSASIGHTITITTSVTNEGPQPADQTLSFALVENSHFTVTGFTGKTTPPPGFTGPGGGIITIGDGDSGGGVASAGANANRADHAIRYARAASGSSSDLGPDVLWFPGPIPAHHTVTAKLTVKAHTVGRTDVDLFVMSDAGDPPCASDDPSRACQDYAHTSIRATAKPAHHAAAATTHGPASSAAQPLADTGPGDTEYQLAAGIAAVVLGAGLTLTGRRRTSAR